VEYFVGFRYNEAVDLWSLGILLFEVYKGQLMFGNHGDFEQMESILQVLPAPDSNIIID
jgi:serine/threonine protein kinase